MGKTRGAAFAAAAGVRSEGIACPMTDLLREWHDQNWCFMH